MYTNVGGGSFLGAPGSLSTLSAVAGSYELVRTDQVVYRFDTSGRLLSVKDRHDQSGGITYEDTSRKDISPQEN